MYTSWGLMNSATKSRYSAVTETFVGEDQEFHYISLGELSLPAVPEAQL